MRLGGCCMARMRRASCSDTARPRLSTRIHALSFTTILYQQPTYNVY